MFRITYKTADRLDRTRLGNPVVPFQLFGLILRSYRIIALSC
ncbi:hypothetical protein CLOSTMETH_02627 [[Clostridium] methylpentosum DSM 5476]|uniref:Uncharacterized protein n=1 Tax=[Clostridium] methylpentosum DSM 5476 TaxID=537013 RepID=C0EFI5_9FIRM|nr:hypothetical protein CLOSTMETH_02627 [[Clostridium] methylpentosum DSM 5476]